MTQADNAKEAEILLPDKTITVGDEVVTVKEFNFVDGLKAAKIGRGIIAALEESLSPGTDDETLLAMAGELFVDHAEAFRELLALSTGKPLEWQEGLSDAEGQVSLHLFWDVNRAFFLRRAVTAAAARVAVQAKPSP